MVEANGNGEGKRKRGGQPGNNNALRHGFYSRKFNTLEISDLATAMNTGLEDEIALLRVNMRRVMEWSDNVSSLDDAIGVLSALGVASAKLAGLMKTQKILGGNQDVMLDAVSEVVQEILRDWGKIK